MNQAPVSAEREFYTVSAKEREKTEYNFVL
jgi:hypothetical protein